MIVGSQPATVVPRIVAKGRSPFSRAFSLLITMQTAAPSEAPDAAAAVIVPPFGMKGVGRLETFSYVLFARGPWS
jgi:hypothetical protein